MSHHYTISTPTSTRTLGSKEAAVRAARRAVTPAQPQVDVYRIRQAAGQPPKRTPLHSFRWSTITRTVEDVTR